MRIRTALGRFLTRFGRFIQSLSVMVMKPDDLIEYSRLAYTQQKAKGFWTGEELVGRGLYQEEKDMLEKIQTKTGQLLLLGVGGGREAIPLAKMGFQVTGVDFVPYMVQQAEKNALKHGLKIKGLVQDISKLKVTPNFYDSAWLTQAMYSAIPTPRKRIAMLKRIRQALKPGGYFLCQFQYYSKIEYSPKVERLRKIFAYLTLGNLEYEKGDMIWRESEYIHTFSSEKKLKFEFEQGGFQIIEIKIPKKNSLWGTAVLLKPPIQPIPDS